MITRSKAKQTQDYQFVSLPEKKRYPLISASYTRNHIYNYKENDLKNIVKKFRNFEFQTSNNLQRRYSDYVTLNSYRKKRGIEFEQKIFQMWESRADIKLKTFENYKWTISNCKLCKSDIFSKEYDILKQVPIINPYNKVGGIPDILIRSDKIKSILEEDYPFDNEPLHYVILEIKYSSEISKYHRNQVYCYNKALKHIQNYEPRCAFIIIKNQKPCMITFTEEDKFRYEKSTSWCRKVKNYENNILPNLEILNISDLSKSRLYKKFGVLPRIRIPYNSLNLPNLITEDARFVNYVFILDIDISAFFLIEKTSIIWHVAILTVDRKYPEKLPTFRKFTGKTFEAAETYKSVNFVHYISTLNSINYPTETIICSRQMSHWDWLERSWKYGFSHIQNIIKNHTLHPDELMISAWNYVNNKDEKLLKKIENNSRIYLNICMKNIR